MKKKIAFSLFIMVTLLGFQACSRSNSKSSVKLQPSSYTAVKGNVFVGKIGFTAYSIKDGHKQELIDSSAVIYFTPQRIRVKMKSGYKVGGGLNAKGVLIRNDSDDVVIFTGKGKAIKFTKDQINSLIGMAAGFTSMASQYGRNKENELGVNLKKTGKSQTVNGYKCNKFIITYKSEPNRHTVVCMTKSVNVNWGFVADIAKKAKESLGKTAGIIPTGIIFKKGYFPVLIKQFKGDKLAAVFKAKITATDNVQSHVQLPPGMKVMDMRQFMIQMMQQK